MVVDGVTDRRLDSREAFRCLTQARSVCVIGASADPATIGGMAVDRLVDHGFDGRIELVNPHRDALHGRPCHHSIADVEGPIDVAMICVSSERVPDIIRQCAAAQVGVAVVVASGFDEGEDGAELAAELRQAGRDAGVRLVGPNTEGVWSIPHRVFLTFGTASARGNFMLGAVSVISQSGGIGTAVVRHLQNRGIGCRYFVGVGNEADLTTLDYLDAIVEEGDGVVAIYTEGLRDGHRLKGIMTRARAAGVPVIVFRAGTSEEGRAATSSHTGRVATASRVYEGIFRQTGVVEVSSISALWTAAETMSVVRSHGLAVGDGALGVISISGGCSGVLADAAVDFGVELATLSPDTLAQLAAALPKYAAIRNPLDPTGAVLRDPALLDNIVDLVAADPAVGCLLVQFGNSALRQIGEHRESLSAIAAQRSVPFVLSSIGDELPTEQHVEVLASGLVWAADPRDAVQRCRWIFDATRRYCRDG